MLRTLATGLALALSTTASAAIVYTGQASFAGNATDLSGIDPAFGGNRLSIGSDLFYDSASNSYWGNTDRGPGGGLIDFAPRAHNFSLDIAQDGSVAGYTLLKTVVFKKDGVPMTGLNPRLAPQGDASVLGGSFDPEGLVVGKNGHFFVSDEYGPSVYEFDADGNYVRAFQTPANLLPRDSNGKPNFVDGRPTIVNGRQDNRGFEGLTLSPDGKTLVAVLQDPLVNEGTDKGTVDGRRSRNVRIVTYSVETGEPTGQFIYQLEALADINARLPSNAQFGGSAQGRNIGLSAIIALDNGKFLVLERDNRGLGVDDPNAQNTPGSKRVYLVDMAGATDVSDISLHNMNNLPDGVVPVTKSLWLDIQAELAKAGITITEKMEGISFGPALDGGYAFVVATDNDFSVTQSGEGVQFNVCTSGKGGVTSQVGLNELCPEGQWLIPSYTYVFKVSGEELAAAGIPEPASWAMLIAGFGLVGGIARRRRAATSRAAA
jgi:hypothetical protein